MCLGYFSKRCYGDSCVGGDTARPTVAIVAIAHACRTTVISEGFLPDLLSPLSLRSVTLASRIVISPMCQYSAVDGFVQDWHLAHYGRLALGRPAMIVVEATAVAPEGRISHGDLGLWSDEHVPSLKRIADFMRGQNVVPAIQLGHAGRKGCAQRPWDGYNPLGADDLAERGEEPWPLVSVTSEPANAASQVPQELSAQGIEALVRAWKEAARRALDAGFEAVEIHAAHGYLLHAFLSPLSNTRTDEFGGGIDNRMRFTLMVAEAIREVWPDHLPLMCRISACDGPDRGWSLEDSVLLAGELKRRGVDVIDCSSGGIGNSPTLLARSPGFQVPFAERIRREAGIATMAVGLILTHRQADDVVANGQADLVAIGREALADPCWPLHARRSLTGQGYEAWAPQYGWWLERREKTLARADQG